MKIAGIDPSLTGTGIAIAHNGAIVAHTKIGYPGHNGASDIDRSRRIVALRHEVVAWVRKHQPDLVLIESPAYSRLFGSACDRHGFWHLLLHEFGVAGPERYAGVTATCRAQFAAGNGHASKQLIVEAVNTWYPHLRLRPRQDNEADAIVLATMGVARFQPDQLQFPLKDWQRGNLDAVAWPVMEGA